eukprot:CAMPEP_0177532148 /NCGR_PEP_ID=MMETSP0369-20130122/54468_1 /TAXON_ID=447022 ORGANISM="Scrippsiella hangoei-like, Strain SHHI-4" /NCGR_SAMPLE_ID=MMETSP0369 /ASSEMBLY_ACC=CAM_ASM_000364 /LENGTH=49 /DNA_ID= /DNA_START= /DNA_END= /DNA_ORIENTATION=
MRSCTAPRHSGQLVTAPAHVMQRPWCRHGRRTAFLGAAMQMQHGDEGSS